MSDTHRRYSAIRQALGQIMPAAPNSHREKHLNTLTSLICGIVGSRHSHLPKIADQSPSRRAKRESRLKRYKRWVMHKDVDYDTYFLPVAEAVLAALAAQPLVLIIDGSTVGRGCMALMLSLVYKGRALPLAWTVVSHVKGHLPEATHCELVAQLAPHIPPAATVIFLGDGEFDGTHLQATIQGYGWQYVCRTASNTLIWSGAGAVQLGDIPLQSADAFAIQNVHMTAKVYGPVLALGVWEADYDAPIYLVTNLACPEDALAWYRQRALIETFFSDQKSRGFHVDKSHLSAPERLFRLLIAACLAYLWIVYLGTFAHAKGYVVLLQRTNRCDLSLFQLGLAFLAHCLNERRRIRVAFIPLPSSRL